MYTQHRDGQWVQGKGNASHANMHLHFCSVHTEDAERTYFSNVNTPPPMPNRRPATPAPTHLQLCVQSGVTFYEINK